MYMYQESSFCQTWINKIFTVFIWSITFLRLKILAWTFAWFAQTFPSTSMIAPTFCGTFVVVRPMGPPHSCRRVSVNLLLIKLVF